MSPFDKVLISAYSSQAIIFQTDPGYYRRELTALAADRDLSWSHRCRALRILGAHCDLLKATGESDVISPLVAMFADEFPPTKLQALAPSSLLKNQPFLSELNWAVV
jgi:hypothetical protein